MKDKIVQGKIQKGVKPLPPPPIFCIKYPQKAFAIGMCEKKHENLRQNKKTNFFFFSLVSPSTRPNHCGRAFINSLPVAGSR